MARKKPTVSMTIDAELLRWLDSKIKTKKFANRSHAVEYCVEFTRKRDKD